MACHLDGGSCPHEYSMGKGGSYPVFGSSSYGGGSSYATLGAYSMKGNGTYQGSMQAGGLANPIGLAAYAADMKYNGAYKSAGAYVPQTTSQKSLGMKNASPVFGQYRSNGQERENVASVNEQDVPELLRQPRDVARPSSTIDDTVASNAVAVQRTFLEQMIQQARAQTIAPQQIQYSVLYS